MKIFLDTAHLESIKKWNFILDGVTTNPSHLSKEGQNPTELVKQICKILPKGDISVEITQTTPEDVYKQAQAIAAIASNVIVKVPCHPHYYKVIEQLVQKGIKVNVTLVFSLVQSLFMCKLGVMYISPFIGRWDDIDIAGADLLYEIRSMIDTYGYQTQMLAASLRHVRHVHEAIAAGSDAATIPVDVLEKCFEHLLTNAGMEKFNTDWQKLGIKQFP